MILPNATFDNTPAPNKIPKVGDQVFLNCEGRTRVGKVRRISKDNNKFVWDISVPEVGHVSRFKGEIEFVFRPAGSKEL